VNDVSGRRAAGAYAALAVALAGVLSVATNLATSAVPASWHWAHNLVLLWSAVGVLVAGGVAVAIAQVRSSPGPTVPAASHDDSVRQDGTVNMGGIVSPGGAVFQGGTRIDTLIIGGGTPPQAPYTAPVRPGAPGAASGDASTRAGNRAAGDTGTDSAGAAAGHGAKAGDNLPPRTPSFTGRAELLDRIGATLADGPAAVVAVRGLGGVGKTQAALEYAHRARDEGRYAVIWWVRADSAVTIAEDLAALAPLTGIPSGGPTGEVAAVVLTALRARDDWLLVFDNASAPSDLAGVLPGGRGHVLITSRNRAWTGVAAPLDIAAFSREESVAFLARRSGRNEPEPAGELAAELGDLPLALAQAAAYIDENGLTVVRYLALYRDPAVAKRLRATGLAAGEYSDSVAATWLLHYEQLRAACHAALDLLRLCAYLDPDDIDLDAVLSGIRADRGNESDGDSADGEAAGIEPATDAVLGRLATLTDPLERAETVGALVRASLVSTEADHGIRVHRLVQAVTRDQLDPDQATAWAKRAIELLYAAFPAKPWQPSCWPVCRNLAPHVLAAVAHAEVYPELAKRRAVLLDRLGLHLEGTAQYPSAHAAYERALAFKEAAYGPSHPQVATTLGNLGNLQRRLGDLDAAQASLERALTFEEASYGPNHPEVAIALANLSIVQAELGDPDAAQASLERALAIKKAAYGPNHPQVATTLANLGIVQKRLGDLDAAQASMERALAVEEAAYGPNHPEVARTLANLGIVQRQLGEPDAARASLKRGHAIFQATFGSGHPETVEAKRLLDDV